MQVSRFGKAIVYEVVTAVLFVLSAVAQWALRTTETPAATYLRTNIFLFIGAAVLLGVGVYSLQAYTWRHREHILDSVFLLAVGAALMVAAITVILLYGGMPTDPEAVDYTAFHVDIVLLTALPVPFLVRSLVLAFSTREEQHGRRLGVQAAVGALVIALVVLLATGGMLRMRSADDVETAGGSQSDGIVAAADDRYT